MIAKQKLLRRSARLDITTAEVESAVKKSKTSKTAPQRHVDKTVAIQRITSEQRHNMVAEAAYFIAEKRSFAGSSRMDDWLQAEADVNAQFKEGK